MKKSIKNTACLVNKISSFWSNSQQVTPTDGFTEVPFFFFKSVWDLLTPFSAWPYARQSDLINIIAFRPVLIPDFDEQGISSILLDINKFSVNPALFTSFPVITPTTLSVLKHRPMASHRWESFSRDRLPVSFQGPCEWHNFLLFKDCVVVNKVAQTINTALVSKTTMWNLFLLLFFFNIYFSISIFLFVIYFLVYFIKMSQMYSR